MMAEDYARAQPFQTIQVPEVFNHFHDRPLQMA
jgi:hypothetical protein